MPNIYPWHRFCVIVGNIFIFTVMSLCVRELFMFDIFQLCMIQNKQIKPEYLCSKSNMADLKIFCEIMKKCLLEVTRFTVAVVVYGVLSSH